MAQTCSQALTSRLNRSANRSLVLAIATSMTLSACGAEPFPFLRKNEHYDLAFCGTKARIPKSYVIVRPERDPRSDMVFLSAAWPDMSGWGGRSVEHGLTTDVRMLIGASWCDRPWREVLSKRFRDYHEGDAPFGAKRPPARKLNDFEGFEHYVRPHTEREMVTSAFSETDILVRRDERGEPEVLIVCPGRAIKPRRYPQCKMWMGHRSNPAIWITVGFDRNKQLSSVSDIEKAVSETVSTFVAAARNAPETRP